MKRASRAVRGEGGHSGRQLKNAAAEPPNRYDARHVPPSATNRRATDGGRGAGASPSSASTEPHLSLNARLSCIRRRIVPMFARVMLSVQ